VNASSWATARETRREAGLGRGHHPPGSPERIEYSQPVLYSHFRGKAGRSSAPSPSKAPPEMAAALRAANPRPADGPRAPRVHRPRPRPTSTSPHATPAVYDAMFPARRRPGRSRTRTTPEPLKDAFAALLERPWRGSRGDGVHPGTVHRGVLGGPCNGAGHPDPERDGLPPGGHRGGGSSCWWPRLAMV